MEWRCEWCGKPHEEEDPPCDNCGHGSFERAVVPVASDRETLGSEATVWVCTECGREHTKHTPPCSRCGAGSLERRRQEVGDDELSVPSYLDLVTPRYVLGLAVVVGLVALVGLGAAGVVDLPGFGSGSGVPSVSDVPGDPDQAGGVGGADATETYLDRLNEQRLAADAASLRPSARLDAVAQFFNRKRVKGVQPTDGELDRVRDVLAEECAERPTLRPATLVPPDTGFESPTALSTDLTDALWEGDVTALGDRTRVGLALHTGADGRVYAFQVVC